MLRTKRFFTFLFLVLVWRITLGAQPLVREAAEPVANWTAPPYWTPLPSGVSDRSDEDGTLATQAIEALPTSPMPFVAMSPCRVVDTRNAPGPYGGPALGGNAAARAFGVPGGPCPGIPGDAGAYSINVASILAAGDGFLTVFPTGTAQPTASDLNFLGGEVTSNSLITPAGTLGSISVFVNVTTNLTIDINGYYRVVPLVNAVNGQAGYVTISTLPAGTSGQTLRHNGTAWIPNNVLTSDGTGVSVNGVLTLAGPASIAWQGSRFLNSTGGSNVSLGILSGGAAMSGGNNTAVGNGALFSDTSGANNTAIGFQSLNGNAVGNNNTAVGYRALLGASVANNTAIGYQALMNNGGGGNIALGSGAGVNLTSGGFNMYLGNEGVSSESATIRLGSGTQHSRLFVAGVLGTTVAGGTPVYISGLGQLGTSTSSARYKEDIRDMGDASDRLFQLRPVTFRYKGQEDRAIRFGLVAEEVDKVIPELVFRLPSGEPETVLYHELPAMLLNELQKQQARIDRQEAEIADLRDRLSSLESRPLTTEAR